MGTSNLDQLAFNGSGEDDISSSNKRSAAGVQDYHQCNSLSSSITPTLINALLENDHGDENSAFCALKINVVTEESKVVSNYDDPKTPTSKEHRIPVTMTCPPAPRKTSRRVVTTNGKRKAAYFPADYRVVVPKADFMVYVDAMLALNEAVFIPDFMVGDLGEGDSNAKRLKPSLPSSPSPAHEL